MKISVAIMTYNGEKYIQRQLETILDQTLPVDEVWISDDCSQDSTVDIIKRFIQKNELKNWFFTVNNANFGYSRNAYGALMNTTGDIIFTADQDDEWTRDKVQIMADLMRNNQRMLLLSSNLICIDRQGNLFRDETLSQEIAKYTIDDTRISTKQIPLTAHLGYSKTPWCASCIRGEIRDILKKGGIPELSKSIGIDGYIALVASIAGQTFHTNLPLLHRRIHGENISLGRLKKENVLSTSNEKRIERLKQAMEAHQYLLQDATIQAMIAGDKREQVKVIISLFERRIDFLSTHKLCNGIKTFSMWGAYKLFGKSRKNAVRIMITDFMYAYNINWKIKRNTNSPMC